MKPSDMPGAEPDYETEALGLMREGCYQPALIFAVLHVGDRMDAILQHLEENL